MRLFDEIGQVFGSHLSVEDAYEELKELSGKDFGDSEADWRRWLETHKAELLKKGQSRLDGNRRT